jgi:hypothetical protein
MSSDVSMGTVSSCGILLVFSISCAITVIGNSILEVKREISKRHWGK